MQIGIGWDNLLRGKLVKDWRIHQSDYESLETKKQKDRNIKRRLELGIMSNPYASYKENTQNCKKKKKLKDMFQ